MLRSIIVTSLVTFLPLSLLGDEPSAFGAGDLSNPQPYGLTSNEEVLLETKKNLHKVVIKTKKQENEVDSLRDRIDGLQSIIESLSIKAQENKKNLNLLKSENTKSLKSRDEYEKRLSEVTQKNSELIALNTQEIERINHSVDALKLIIKELSSLIDTINTTYVTKDELNALVLDVNKFKDLIAKELKNSVKSKKSSLSSMTNAQIEKKARALYDKKYYTKAIEYYSYLIDKKYKPARAHYMIGEMYYYRKDYANAIAYFKKSASLYSKASYMPVLMLHTARAMEKTGDKKNAKAFYKGIIAKYPDSKYVKEAKKYLNLMKQ